MLLDRNDPQPVSKLNAAGRSPFLLIGDHAGAAIPRALGDLGVAAADRARHIALDIGIQGLGATLAARIDAVFISQRYSRLVIDCNRDPAVPGAMPEVSDGTPIPANMGLADAGRAARVAEIHAPYQQAIAAEIAAREARGLETILIALHSFTPVMGGFARPWHAGVLHSFGDARYALKLIAALRSEPDLVVGDNEPYQMDLIDYTIPLHAFPRRLRYAEIEIRQDLIAAEDGQRAWAERLARVLQAAAD
jgi:predicted N-formylglutamate amidohydrolase